jgi:hypothetical protein
MLMKLDDLVEGTILKRPSSLIKSPYVADISLQQESLPILGHCPSLGCCGLAEKDSIVLMGPSLSKTKSKSKDESKLKCSHVVYLSLYKERNQTQVIGIHPKLAEKLVHSALINNCFAILNNIQSLKAETKMFIQDKVDSRFDFTGIDRDGIPFILEVKNVPLADYEDITSKERKNKNYDSREINSKIACFPDGYRKKKEDPVSPRALKHIKELTYIVSQQPKTRCLMVYVIQRTDISSFQPSLLDTHYREAFIEAFQAGVEIIPFVVSWNSSGEAYFVRDDLHINI